MARKQKLGIFDTFKTKKEAIEFAKPLRKLKGNVVRIYPVDLRELGTKKSSKRFGVFTKF